MRKFLIGASIVLLSMAGIVNTMAYEVTLHKNIEAKVQKLRENSNGSRFIRKEVAEVVYTVNLDEAK